MSEFFKHEGREIKAPVAETEKFFDFNEFGLHGERRTTCWMLIEI